MQNGRWGAHAAPLAMSNALESPSAASAWDQQRRSHTPDEEGRRWTWLVSTDGRKGALSSAARPRRVEREQSAELPDRNRAHETRKNAERRQSKLLFQQLLEH